MKDICFALYFLLFLSPVINAQSVSVTTNSKGQVITNISSKNMNRRGGISYTNYTILGSPFLGDTPWHLGTITIDNDTAVSAVLSYDLTNNTLYTIDSVSQQQIEIHPTAFSFEGAEFIRFQTHLLGFKDSEYGNLIYDGTTKLLVKLHKFIKRPNNFHFSGFNEDGVYWQNNEYYIQKKEGDFERLNLNNRAILTTLADRKNEVMEFIKSKAVNLQNEKDLIAVLQFYDGLTGE